MVGSQSEREDKVSLELSEEVLQSMEVGISFRDYVLMMVVDMFGVYGAGKGYDKQNSLILMPFECLEFKGMLFPLH
ncbi:hypothetical protein WN943_006060 [Citrus x changshan-huyou]